MCKLHAWQISQLRLSLGVSVVTAESCCHRASGAVNGHVCDCTAVRPCHRGQSRARDTLSSPCQMMGPGSCGAGRWGEQRGLAREQNTLYPLLNNCTFTDGQVLWEYIHADFRRTIMPVIHKVLHIPCPFTYCSHIPSLSMCSRVFSPGPGAT